MASRMLSRDGYGTTYVRKKKTKPGDGVPWPEKKRVEVATTYIATGSPTLTAAITGVPIQTIEKWKKLPWWKEMLENVREAEDTEMSNKLKGVVDKALNAVVDRIENGDWVFNSKTGKVERVPVKLRDAQRTLNDSLDKRMLLQKRPTRITEHQTTVSDRLEMLAQQFADFTRGTEDNIRMKTIDVEEYGEMSDAVHDEREARLQEGAGLGAQEETQESEGKGNA